MGQKSDLRVTLSVVGLKTQRQFARTPLDGQGRGFEFRCSEGSGVQGNGFRVPARGHTRGYREAHSAYEGAYAAALTEILHDSHLLLDVIELGFRADALCVPFARSLRDFCSP